MKRTRKSVKKKVIRKIWHDGSQWTVHFGELKRPPGRPGKVEPLFKIVGEKLPYDSLDAVRQHLDTQKIPLKGVYIAHDSMGCPRYIGRGSIFSRLKTCKKLHDLELEYFSFYIVLDNKHEREVETLLIRAAGTLLFFNDRKKRVDIAPGQICDYEAGTSFYQRHVKKGRKS